jgi:anti-sigma regulatory factor (Ser/Thr protein kinase)
MAERLSGLSDEDEWIVLLLTHELVSNAFEHGRGAILVEVSLDDGRLQVGVSDESSEQPVLGQPHPGDARGRGIYLVDRLATSWGVSDDPSPGKTVWFELQLGVVGYS